MSGELKKFEKFTDWPGDIKILSTNSKGTPDVCVHKFKMRRLPVIADTTYVCVCMLVPFKCSNILTSF